MVAPGIPSRPPFPLPPGVGGAGSLRTARVLSGAAALAVLLAGAPAGAHPAPRARVVVQGPGAADAVRRAGGRVTSVLPIVDGVAADVPASAVPRLAAAPGIRAVTPDAEVRVASVAGGDGSGTVRSVYRDEIGATALAARGVTGNGVRVALVDTGVTEVPDLAGRVVDVADPGGTPAPLRSTVHCVDFSGEGDCVDRYGHGTFLAGLIAGNGAASGGRYAGVAPGAQIVSLKIAGRNGAADVSKVLAAIQWVVSFHDEYGIKVLNLSLGTPSQVPYEVDPLNFAVEQAWRAGITVVVAAGNTGPRPGTVSKPGDDPFVITVGAVDDRETTSLNDDRLPSFSSRGPTHDGIAKPDVVAPGAKLVSLRLTDSAIEQAAGPGSMAATYPAYRRGSGTSMATAVTSGAVALLLQRHPDWTPDRVKYALTATARRVASNDRRAVGSGLIQAQWADWAPEGLANQGITSLANGTGSLEDSRGGVHVGTCKDSAECARCDDDATCPPVTGEHTAQGRPYVENDYVGKEWTDRSWYTSQWAAPLLDTGWYGTSWLGNSWNGTSWLGTSWLGSSFYGESEGRGDSYGTPARGGAWYGAWL
jgi:serine protease AprX